MDKSCTTICFKLHSVDNPFDIKGVISPCIYPVDWSVITPKELSVSFNNQVKNNYLLFVLLSGQIEETGDFGPVDVRGTIIGDYDINHEQKAQAINSFKIRDRDICEVFSRDHDAFNHSLDVALYVHVLLSDGIYQGHIYQWLSTIDQKYTFAIGIRGRIDSVFTKFSSTHKCINNVSHYLLESIRQVGLLSKCDNIIVAYPLPVMRKILPRLGFNRTAFDSKILCENTLAPIPYFGVCMECFQLTKPENSLINLEVILVT